MQQLVDDDRLPSYRLVHDPARRRWLLYAGEDELDALPDSEGDGNDLVNVTMVKRWAESVVELRHGYTVTGWKRRTGTTTVEYAAKLSGKSKG
jgi:hypothetical protein